MRGEGRREREEEGERGRKREGVEGGKDEYGGIEKRQMQLAKQGSPTQPHAINDVINHRLTSGQEFDSPLPSHA